MLIDDIQENKYTLSGLLVNISLKLHFKVFSEKKRPLSTGILAILLAIVIAVAAMMTFVPIPFHKLEAAAIGATYPPRPENSSIIIIGDSITLQYLPILEKELANCVNIFHLLQFQSQSLLRRIWSPAIRPLNAQDSSKLKEQLPFALEGHAFDLALINVGLHDIKLKNKISGSETIIDNFRNNLDAIFGYLKKRVDIIAFVSTTPVIDGLAPYNIYNVDASKFNQTAMSVAKKHNVDYVDIDFNLSRELSRFYSDDGLHLSDTGAKHIASIAKSYIINRLDIDAQSRNYICDIQ